MILRIDLSRQAERFLENNNIHQEKITETIQQSVQKLRGENINIDIKKLQGKWQGFHRIRKGKIRIIVEFDFDAPSVFIEAIDWRGNAYKK